MKISVDVGALCSKNHFGNYILTQNFIEAINLYDHKNEYYLYSFCDKPEWLKTNKNIRYLKLTPKPFWMNFRVSIEETLHKKDIFLALNQAIPLFTTSKIISFCHGLSYFFYPQYYPDSYQKLKSQLETMVEKSSYIIVSSEKVKNELTTIFRKIEGKIKVLPYGIPFDIFPSRHPERSEGSSDRRERYASIDSSASPQNDNKHFFLYVGMNHPIKNIDFLKKAVARFPGYKLYIAENCSRVKLRKLYRQATAYLAASYYESFNLPVLEALSQGCPVIGLKSAIIPELKKYSFMTNNKEKFVVLMKEVAAKKEIKKIDLENLKSEFSWEKYIWRLTTLY